MQILSLEDFFGAGIGFDLAGACLVALGLLSTPRQIADSMDLFREGNAYQALAALDDRINGESGLCFLAAGFLLQAIGYVDTTGRSGVANGGGWAAVGVALWIVIAFAAAAVGARFWRHWRLAPSPR